MMKFAKKYGDDIMLQSYVQQYQHYLFEVFKNPNQVNLEANFSGNFIFFIVEKT